MIISYRLRIRIIPHFPVEIITIVIGYSLALAVMGLIVFSVFKQRSRKYLTS